MKLESPCLSLNTGSEGLVTGGLPRNKSFRSFRREFQLDDACAFIKSGVDVSSCLHSSLPISGYTILCYVHVVY